MCQMKASLINIRLTSRYSAGSYAFTVKDFVHYFRRLRSTQGHSFMAARTCLRSVETNFTLTCPSPKSFVCNLPDSERHMTSVFQCVCVCVCVCVSLSLSLPLPLSRSVGWVGENPGNEFGTDRDLQRRKRAPLNGLSLWNCCYLIFWFQSCVHFA